MRWDAQDSLRDLPRKLLLVAMATRFSKAESTLDDKLTATARHDKQIAENALIRAFNIKQDLSDQMDEWLVNLLTGAGLEKFREHLFDLGHGEFHGESLYAESQGGDGEALGLRSMNDVRKAYAQVREAEEDTRKNHIHYLRLSILFYKLRKSLWHLFSVEGSAERDALLQFKPDEPDWRLRQGISITTLAWEWITEATHGPMTDKELKKAGTKLRNVNFIGCRLSSLQRVLGDDFLYFVSPKLRVR